MVNGDEEINLNWYQESKIKMLIISLKQYTFLLFIEL